ncbi:MAG TPA: hypothetical protein V6D28_27915 [Leptolyngbyaceae cyanobacterium]
MKVLQYKDLPSQGILEWNEITPPPDSIFPEGVHFETPDKHCFIRHVWARNLHPKFEVLVISRTETPPDAQKRAEIASGAIAFLLGQNPPVKTLHLSKQQLKNLHQSN